jgi:C-terminal processing protease CtpA/Prc
MSERELFEVCSNLLGELNDSHVYLMSPFKYFNSGGRFDVNGIEDFSLDIIETYLNDFHSVEENMFLYGKFKSRSDVGYIHIAGFAKGSTGTAQSQDWVRAINGIIDSLAGTKAIVLDIRGNRGGLQANVDYIAARFADEEKDYVEVRTKDGPGRNDFSSPITHTVKPAGTRYTNPVILITNGQTKSGGEWFTLALLTQDHVTHTGSATNGAFSLSLERSLINGWIYSVSVQKVTDMRGNCYEGKGISPDAEHAIAANITETPPAADAQLDYALALALTKIASIP